MAPPTAMPPALPPAPEPEPEEEEPEDNPEDLEEEAGYKPGRRRRVKLEPNEDYPDEANRAANRIERGWKRRLRT